MSSPAPEFSATTADLVPDPLEWGYWISCAVCTLPTLLLLVVQTASVYSDLCTVERKSVKKRRILPKLTPLHKATQHVTLLCIFFYFWAIAWDVYKTGDKVRNQDCKSLLQVIVWPYSFAKAMLYTAYLLRLLATYGGTKYGYNPRIVYALIGYQLLSGVVSPSIMTSIVETGPIDYDGFPEMCAGDFKGAFVYYAIWDFVMNFLCLTMFLIPLRRVIKDASEVQHAQDKSRERALSKMQYVGTKITLLTAFATLTSVTASLLFEYGGIPHVFPYDWAMNSYAIALMTVYYPNKTYYERICCLCLRCLPVNYRSEPRDEDAQKNEEEVFSKIETNTAKVFVSADTQDAVTYAAKQLHHADKDPLELTEKQETEEEHQ